MQVDASPTDIRRAAMDMLARREHARGELAAKLRRRFGDHPEVVEAEIDKLQAEGLQSDARLAESFIRYRAGRGQGPLKIRGELRGRGVSEDVIGLAMEECDIDWFELALSVCRKRFGELPPEDAREKARRARFLQQRGFSFDHITSLF